MKKILLIALLTASLTTLDCSNKVEERKENPITNETDKNAVNSFHQKG